MEFPFKIGLGAVIFLYLLIKEIQYSRANKQIGKLKKEISTTKTEVRTAVKNMKEQDRKIEKGIEIARNVREDNKKFAEKLVKTDLSKLTDAQLNGLLDDAFGKIRIKDPYS